MKEKRLLTRKGPTHWKLHLEQPLRDVLSTLAQELDALIIEEPDEPGMARLFPVAYPDDVAHEAEWQVFKAGELRSGLREHLVILAAVTDRTLLSDDEVRSWMRSLNAIRLVLGTRLEVTEDDEEVDLDPDDPQAPDRAVYEFLGMLLNDTLMALAA